MKFELYLRVWGDRHGHHQDMIPLSEEPPQASVVSPNIQVPNMEALSRRQTDKNDLNDPVAHGEGSFH